MPVRRRKYFEKNEGLAKCISSAICAAGLSVWRSSIFIRVMRARSIQSLAVTLLVWRIMVLRAIEDGLLARTTAGLLVDLLLEQLVVVVHLGCYESCDGGTMIVVGGMNHLPNGVQNMSGSSDILFADK